MTFVAWGVWVPDPEPVEDEATECPECKNLTGYIDSMDNGTIALTCWNCWHKWTETIPPEEPTTEVELSDF